MAHKGYAYSLLLRANAHQKPRFDLGDPPGLKESLLESSIKVTNSEQETVTIERRQ
jgi:hypothetical protein